MDPLRSIIVDLCATDIGFHLFTATDVAVIEMILFILQKAILII